MGCGASIAKVHPQRDARGGGGHHALDWHEEEDSGTEEIGEKGRDMTLAPAVSKLDLDDRKKLHRAAEVFLEFGIKKAGDIENLEEKLAKSIRKDENPVPKEHEDWMGKVHPDHMPEVYKTKGCRIKDTAARGISLQQLEELGRFIETVLATPDVEIKDRQGAPQTWEMVNLYVINSFFVVPLAWKEQVSFVELVAEAAQVPLWFISHWWGTPFHQSLRMLSLHHKARELQLDSYYWMCTFANNQHELDKELGGELSNTPFLRVLNSEACCGTVALMDRNATPFSRMWCVLEAFEAMNLGLPYDMAAWMEEGDARRAGRACAAQASVMLGDEAATTTCEEQEFMSWPFPSAVAKAAAHTEVKKAESSREVDKQLILDYIYGREEELDGRIHEKTSRRAIHGFVKDGEVPMTRKLLDKFPTLLNEPLDSFGATPTFVAAEFGQLEALEILMESGADINKSLNSGATPTLTAAQKGNLECLRALISSGADVNKSSNTGATPTYVAACDGNVECLRALISSRADVEKSKSDNGKTPTYVAAQRGNLACLRALISSRADVDKGRSDDGSTPTFIAAHFGNLECLQALISSRADMDKGRSDTGATPTLIAAQQGNVECLRALISSRADVDKGTSNDGKTLTYVAACDGNLECLRALTSSRADVDKGMSDDGATPIFIAAQQGNLECLRTLISSRADLDKGKSDASATPIFIAAEQGNLECLRALISSRADLDKGRSSTGATPLAIARRRGHDGVVQELLRAGATG